MRLRNSGSSVKLLSYYATLKLYRSRARLAKKSRRRDIVPSVDPPRTGLVEPKSTKKDPGGNRFIFYNACCTARYHRRTIFGAAFVARDVILSALKLNSFEMRFNLLVRDYILK